MRIVLCYPLSEALRQQIAAAAPGAEVVDAGQEGIAREILSADIFCGHAKVPVPWAEVVRQGRLQWIQSSAAGVDHCLTPDVVESTIPVTSASGVLADQVAEHTLSLILAWMRNLPVFWEAQKKKEFLRQPTRDLHRKTVGLVGFGGVGRRLAQILTHFKTRILASDWYPVARPAYVESLLPASDWELMLPELDLLVLAAPLTKVTRGMINRRIFAQLKPTTLIVNVARGPLIVEADLVAALREQRIAGAVLDVTEQEPLPATSELWDLPQVLITPHVGGQTARRAEDMTEFFIDNLQRWQQGRPLRNVIDKRLGFPPPDLTRLTEP